MGAAEITAQFERLEGNVSAALSAVASKGVTVPSGSTSDNLASLIASIIVLDLSVVTVTPETLAEGITAYDASGNLITGTAQIVEDTGGGYTNMLPLSIDSSGNVVGLLKRHRYNSSGLLVEATYDINASGYIPVKAGDIVRFANWTFRSGMTNYGSCYIDNFDTSFVAKYKVTPATIDGVLENIKDSDGDVAQVTVKIDGYIAVCSVDLTEDTIITVNEEIT